MTTYQKEKIGNLKDLTSYLLYKKDNAILVGIVGDANITDKLTEKLASRIRKLLMR